MMDERLSAAALFELGGWFGADLFRADEPVWAALERLDEWLVERTAGCGSPHAPDGAWLRGDVVVGSGVVIEPG